MLWLYIALGSAAASVIPLARFCIKRYLLCIKVKRLCRRMGYCLHKTHKLWFLGNRRRKSFDFSIETQNEIYCVKLFGMLKKNSKLIIKENGDYAVRKYYAFLSSKSQAMLFSESTPAPFDEYSFETEGLVLAKRKILLVQPLYLDIVYQAQYGKPRYIDSGDLAFGMEIYTQKGFLGYLDK